MKRTILTTSESCINFEIADTENLGPFGDRLGFAPNRDKTIRSSVSRLLRRSGPIAIIGTIWAIILSTFERQLWGRARSHIGQEIFKLLPSFTNKNSPRAIIFKRIINRVYAALFHVLPNVPFARFRFAMPKTTRKIRFPTAATLNITPLKMRGGDNGLASAITKTKPAYLLFFEQSFVTHLNDCQPSYPFPSKILKPIVVCASAAFIFFIHAVFIPYNTAFGQADIGYLVRTDCGALTPVEANTICLQSTTANGRTSGKLYSFTGGTWVEVAASSSGGHVIKDDGTARPQRTNLDLIGTGVSCVDSSGNDATECTVDVGGAPPFDTITTGANTTATMTVGTGAAITTSGSGTIAATTAAALAANGADCAAGSGARGVTAAGVGENCVDFLEEPTGTGVVAKTAANTTVTRTITGTGGITVGDGDGIAGNPTISPGATIVETDQANTYGAFNQDFTAASVTLPNSAGASPASDNQMAVDTTAGSVKVKIGGTVYSLATTLGTFDAFSADPAGCVLANGEWTNDIDASGVSNCVVIHSSGAAAPTAGTVRFAGEIYQDTRAYSCSTQTGLTYIGQAAGGNFTPILAQPDGYTTFTGDTGTVSPCGADTIALKSNAATTNLSTVVTAASSSSPDTVTFYSKLLVHATDCTALTGKDGQACWEQDSDAIYVCEPTAGDCDTALEWKLASGGGGGVTNIATTAPITGGAITTTGTIACATCVTSASSLGDTAFVTGAGAQGSQTPSSAATLNASGDASFPGGVTTGTGGGISGSWTPAGATSGNAKIQVASVAGSPAPLQLPTATGGAGLPLVTDGADPQQLSFAVLGSAAFSTAITLRTCTIVIPGTGASAVLQDADMSGVTDQSDCFVPYAATLIEVTVKADTGTPNIIVGRDRAGTIANLVSGALATAAAGAYACSRTGAVACYQATATASATLQNTGLLAGDYLGVVSGTAGGTAHRITVSFTYSVN